MRQMVSEPSICFKLQILISVMGDVVKREYRCTDHEHRAIYTLSYYQSANIVQDAVVVLNLRESSSPVQSIPVQ